VVSARRELRSAGEPEIAAQRSTSIHRALLGWYKVGSGIAAPDVGNLLRPYLAKHRRLQNRCAAWCTANELRQ
jgi:hypothetical protein